MKKIMLVLLVLVSLTKVSNAQKGSVLLYGNVGFSTATDSFGTSSNAYNFNPGIGYQFADHWTTGISFGIGGTRTEEEQGNVPTGNYNTTSNFNILPFLRYSYPISNIFSVYGQFEVGYLSGKQTPFGTDGGSYSGFGTDFFPALGINIKNGWAVNLSFGGISYQSKSYKGDIYNNSTTNISATSSNTFAIGFGSGATFGISKNFGGTKKS